MKRVSAKKFKKNFNNFKEKNAKKESKQVLNKNYQHKIFFNNSRKMCAFSNRFLEQKNALQNPLKNLN